jgi:DNA-binding transcriptional MerR regulator
MTTEGLTIAEVAERTGLTRHTLRYYERAGLMFGVDRASSGHRRYSEGNLSWIELITKLRATGMPIGEVRHYADLVRAGDGNEDERMALLVAHRDRVRMQIDSMTACLDAIESKVRYYAGAIETCESPDRYLSSPHPSVAAGPPQPGSRRAVPPRRRRRAV